jgi:hypothetical protein
MATLSIQIAVIAGLTPAYGACAAGGDEFVNSGREVIHVKNGHTAPQTVTVNSQAACSQGFDHDAAVVVTNAQERIIGPFPKARFDDPNAKVQLTYSGVTALTIAVIQVP